MKTVEQIARARLLAIKRLINMDAAENEGANLRLLKNGFVPEEYIDRMNGIIDQEVYARGNKPLTSLELTTHNTWFAIHPEKVAGVMEKTTSLMFPLRCKGTIEQVKDMFSNALIAENKEPDTKTQDEADKQRRIRIARARAKALKLKAQALLMLQNELEQYVPTEILQQLQGLGVMPVGTAKYIRVGSAIGELTMQRYRLIAKEQNNTQLSEAIDWASKVSPFYQPMAVEAAYKVLQLEDISLPPLQRDFRTKKWLGRYSYATASFQNIIIPSTVKTELAESNYWYDMGGVEVVSQQCVRKKWHSQSNVLLHELGHHIAVWLADGVGRRKAIRRNSNAHQMIANAVSMYGATKWSEFDAETISGILAGKQYPKKILDMLPKSSRLSFAKLIEKGTIGMHGFDGIDDLNGEDVVNYKNFYSFCTNVLEKNATWYDQRFKSLTDNVAELAIFYGINDGCTYLVDKYCHELSKRVEYDIKQSNDKERRLRIARVRAKALKLKAQALLLLQEQSLSGGTFEYFKGSIMDLVAIAKKAGNDLVKKIISPASQRLINDLLKENQSIDSTYVHVIDVSGIRHIFNEHGKEDELLRGQIPVTDSDFDKIPNIVANYDKVSVGDGKRGLKNIVYEKTYPNGTTIYVEECRKGRHELATLSMRIMKKKNSTLTGANHNDALSGFE